MTTNQPSLVSIGMPVFNEESTIEMALDDLLSQSHSNLEIMVSDNASTDRTGEIVERLASFDSRITYVRQSKNFGAHANFRYVLQNAHGYWFMWAAADDRWAPAFIVRNLERLESDANLVGCISKVRWDGGSDVLAAGTRQLRGTPAQKISCYLKTARDNTRFYGLFRREVLLESYPKTAFYSADLAVMLGTLMQGEHGEVPEVLMTRRRRDPESYIDSVHQWNEARLDRWFPLLPFTRYALFDARIPRTPRIISLLLVRNVYEHVRWFARTGRLYGRLCTWILSMTEGFRRRLIGASREP